MGTTAAKAWRRPSPNTGAGVRQTRSAHDNVEGERGEGQGKSGANTQGLAMYANEGVEVGLA